MASARVMNPCVPAGVLPFVPFNDDGDDDTPTDLPICRLFVSVLAPYPGLAHDARRDPMLAWFA